MFGLVTGLRKHLEPQMFFNQAIKTTEYLIGNRAKQKKDAVWGLFLMHNSGINNKYNGWIYNNAAFFR